MLPQASAHFAPLIFTLSVVAVIYTSLVALAQEDMKKLIAYSSVAHMGVVTIGIFTFNVQGIQGALFQMLSHGIVSGALFLVVGVVYDRIHTREIARYGGLADRMPLYALTFMIFTLASIGLPGTSGFVGEFLVIVGALQVNFWLALLGAMGMILGVAYMLYLYRRVIFGRLTKEDLRAILDLSPREIAVFVPLILLTLWMGIYPSSFTGLLGRLGGGDGAAPHGGAGAGGPGGGSAALMNWAIALPEIALSVVAMAILIFGVLRRDDTFFLTSMFALGGFLLAALLVLTATRGVGYHGQFVVRRVLQLREDPGAGGRGARADPVARLQPQEPHRALRISRADAAVRHRHDGDGIGLEPDDAVSRARTAIARALRAGGVRARRSALVRGRPQVFRARRACFRPAALRHFAGLRLLRHHGLRRAGEGADRGRRPRRPA